jgi:hypothetical protein
MLSGEHGAKQVEPISIKGIVEIIAVVTIPIAIVAIVWNRIRTNKGLSVRAIQFMGLAVLPSTILILALEGFLEPSAVGALIGALVGYLFAGVGEYDRNRSGGGDALADAGQNFKLRHYPISSLIVAMLLA